MDEFHEGDLKPLEGLRKYFQLIKEGIPEFFPKSELNECSCPACSQSKIAAEFTKYGMRYIECESCNSLWVSPRPSEIALIRYFEESKAEIFWRNEFIHMTDRKRKEKILQPWIRWITESTQEYYANARSIADIHTKQPVYLDELQKIERFQEKVLISPFLSQTVLKEHPSMRVFQEPAIEGLENQQLDVITVFDGLGMTADPFALLSAIFSALAPGGLCFLTTTLISGFDLQTLWDAAENIHPPTRLNIFSDTGLLTLVQKTGFECIEFSTPGVLDLEIVAAEQQKNSSNSIPRFIAYLLKHRDENTHKAFQEFLQAHRLSSYGRLLLRKPT